MKRTLLAIAAATVLSAPAMGKYNRMFEMYTKVADVDADGLDDILLIDASTGHFVTGFGQSGGGFAWQTPRQIPSGGYNSPIRLLRNAEKATVADLDNDGASDLAISLYHHNRVLVFRGSSTRSRALSVMEEYFPGPGPAGIAAAQLDTASPELELVMPVLALTQPRIVSVLPRVGWEVLVSHGPIDVGPVGEFSEFAIMTSAGVAGPLRHFAAWTSVSELPDDTASSWMRVAQLPTSSSSVATEFAEPYRRLSAANMRGPGQPGQFVVWDAGLDSLAIATVIENPGAIAIETVVVQVEGIDYVSPIGGPGGLDRIAVVHQSGARVIVFGWDSARNRFDPLQTLMAPQGRTFAGPVGKLAAGAGGLFAMMSDGGYLKYQFDTGGQLQLTHQGLLPQLPGFGGHATVMLYTADPLSGEAFEFESFVAGQWATGATFAGGKINAMREIFQSASLGLGQPVAVQLTPTANPGASARAQANQFGDPSSSLFYAGEVSADGDAGVEISPPPGDYSTPIHVQFTPAEASTTVVYRVNGQAWQQAGAAGFFAASDALVEYYGQSTDGALSLIQAASYQVSLTFGSDANHDGLPDDIAVALGLDPFGHGDADRDGVSDINEVLNDSDPFNATSFPNELAVEFPPRLKVDLVSNIPVMAGEAPALNVSYTLFLPNGMPVRAQTSVRGRITGIAVDPSSISGTEGGRVFRNSMIVEAKLPASDQSANGTSMLGMVFPPELALPELSSGGGPEWKPVARYYLEHGWPRKVGGLKLELIAGAEGSETQAVVADAETTIAVAAFSAWTYHTLQDAGRGQRRFPWDHRGGRTPVPVADIAFLEEPQGPARTAHELAHVVQQLHREIVENPAYAPLRLAVREMIEADGDPERPFVLGRMYNAAQAILDFFDTGVLDEYYAGVITPTPAVMQALRARLLGVPQPRTVVAIEGGITHFERKVIGHTADGGEYDLRGTTSFSEIVEGEILITRRPWLPSIPLTAGGTYSMVLMASAFLTAAPGEPQPMEVFSISPATADLSRGVIDMDGDGMDDAFESYFFNGLSQAFWDDSDHDGFADGEEYLALADPANTSDVPPGIPSTPRTLWTKAQFGENWNDPAIAADAADPDLDGMANILEYMTGGDPDNPNDAPQPRAASHPDGRLGLAFTRLPARTDIVIDVEGSETLTGPWQVVARSTRGGVMTAMVTGVTVVESGTGPTRQVNVTGGSSPAVPTSTRWFLRVSVTSE